MDVKTKPTNNDLTKVVIPESLINLALVFTYSKNRLNSGLYSSDDNEFNINYTDDSPSYARISRLGGVFSIRRPDAMTKSQDFVYFTIINMWLIRHFSTEIEDELALYKLCDLTAIHHCIEKGFNLKLIYRQLMRTAVDAVDTSSFTLGRLSDFRIMVGIDSNDTEERVANPLNYLY